METLLKILQTDILGLIATIIGLVYLYLEFRAKKSMWLASIVMAFLYIYIFFKSEFYAMSVIYGYFLVISIWGWHKWHQKQLSPAGLDSSQKSVVPLERMPKERIPQIVGYLLLSTLIIAGILYLFTETTWTILLSDTIATSLNVVAIWMATRRWAEQWSLLIPANLLTGIMLFIQAQYPSSIMFMIYFIVSIFGYFHWVKLANKHPASQ